MCIREASVPVTFLWLMKCHDQGSFQEEGSLGFWVQKGQNAWRSVAGSRGLMPHPRTGGRELA